MFSVFLAIQPSALSSTPVPRYNSGRCEPRLLGCFPENPTKGAQKAVEYLAGYVHSPSQCANLCARHKDRVISNSGTSGWSGLFALQFPGPKGTECYCGTTDTDHAKHTMEGAKCVDEYAGVCYKWKHADGRSTSCTHCSYPHDMRICGGTDANAVYHVDHCITKAGFEELIKREAAATSASDSNACTTQRRFRLSKRGCLRDSPTNRVLLGANGPTAPVIVDSPWECAFACAQQGMLAFGLEFGNECYCEHVDALNKLLLDGGKNNRVAEAPEMCDTHMCTNSLDYCGGNQHLTAYEVIKC